MFVMSDLKTNGFEFKMKGQIQILEKFNFLIYC